MKEFNNYTQLPEPDKLKELLITQAILDTIMVEEEDSWLRVTTYYKNYSENMEMVNISNGAGDHMFILFSDYGTLIKGFDHESIISPYGNEGEEPTKGIYDFVPKELMDLMDESIEQEDVTFCLWRSKTDSSWKKGEVTVPAEYKPGDDGEDFLLGLIWTNADSWFDWARDYYDEQGIQLEAVKKVFQQERLTKEIIKEINPEREPEDVMNELKEMI